MNLFSKMKWNVLGIFGVVILLSSCLKNDIQVDNTPRAYLMLAHMAIHAPKAKLFINDTYESSGSLNTGVVSSAYSAFQPGSYKFAFKHDSKDSFLVAPSNRFDIDSGKAYTIISYSDYDSTTKLSVTEDDFSKASSTNAIVRFFQLSPVDQMVDVYLDDVKMWSNRSLADHVTIGNWAEFEVVTPKIVDIKVTKAGEPDQILVSLSSQSLQSQYAYTIWFYGMDDSAIDKRYSLKLQAAMF